MALQANRPLPDSYRLGELTIEKVLSSGGFSIVYLARDGSWEPYVIKEFLPGSVVERLEGDAVRIITGKQGLFNRGLRSFMDEAAALAKVNHPNVVRVRDFFRANGTAYMTMDYVRGRTLHFLIHAQRERLDETFLRSIIRPVLGGLREVHLRRLLHLDLKPANILIGADAQPLLLDFGAVRNTLDQVEPTLRTVLTEGFAAPEQHQGDLGLGPWTDIYAIGATLYSCMAFQPPPSARLRVREDRLIPARERFAGQFSAELLTIVDWCLQLDPLMRPQSVYTLQRALADGAGLPPALALPASGPVWSLGRLVDRMRGLVSSRIAGHQVTPVVPPLQPPEPLPHASKPPR